MITPVELTASTIELFALDDLTSNLRDEDAYDRSGRTAASLARGDDLTPALTVARAGDVRHALRAEEDSAFLVIIGGRTESRRRQ